MTVAEAIVYQWVKDFGVPELLVMDKASIFRSQLTQEVGKLLGIRMHTFPAESQWRNGRVERVHRYLGERLRVWRREKMRSWHRQLPFVEMAHHFLVMPKFGMAPYQILFGTDPRLPFTRMEWSSGGHPSQAYLFVHSLHLRLREIQGKFHEMDMEHTMQRLRKLRSKQALPLLEKGDKALIYTKGTKDKFLCVWSDLVEVVSKVDGSTFRIRYPNGAQEDVSSQRLRRFLPGDNEDQDVLGPFVTDYPTLERKTPEPVHAPLPERKVTIGKESPVGVRLRAPNPKVTELGPSSEESKDSTEAISYGDFIAYYEDDHGWGVGQLLDDEGDTPEDFLCVRYLDSYQRYSGKTSPRQYAWRYHWTSAHGPDIRSKAGAGPSDKPTAKRTGGLTATYVELAKDDFISVVALTQDHGGRRLDSESWNRVLRRVDLKRPGSRRFL